MQRGKRETRNQITNNGPAQKVYVRRGKEAENFSNVDTNSIHHFYPCLGTERITRRSLSSATVARVDGINGRDDTRAEILGLSDKGHRQGLLFFPDSEA